MNGFALNEKYGWYEGKLSEIQVIPDADKASGIISGCALDNFREYEATLSDWNERLCRYAAEKLIGTADDWRADDAQPPLSEEKFA